MEKEKKIDALILEKDREVAKSIERALKDGPYAATLLTGKEEAIRLLKEKPRPLTFVGESEDSGSIFQTMREIVMASPMTSMILITDLPEEEIEDKAEGYGILGHIGRDIGVGDLALLVDRFEEILKSSSPPTADKAG